VNRILLGTLRRRWLRTLLVGLSTLVAFMLLGVFLAVRHGFAVGPVQAGANLLFLEPVVGNSPLPLGLLSTVRTFPGVRSAVGVLGTEMLYGAHRHPLTVVGLSPNAFLELSDVVGSGALLRAQARRWLTDPTGALVSAETAHKNGWRLGQTITLRTMPSELPRNLTFQIDGLIGKIKGVNLSSEVNLQLGNLRRWTHSNSLNLMFVQVKKARQAGAVAQAIEQYFSNSTTPVTTQSFASLLQGIAERLADVSTITFVVIVASLFGLFLVTFNTVIHSVAERIGEFALLKAVGFTPVRLLCLVFLEAFLVIVPSAATGTLCAWFLVRALADLKLNLPGLLLTPAALVDCGLVAFGLAVLSSVLPGLRVARLNCGRVLRKG